MNPNQHCLGHVLTTAGYQTGYIGKWHLYANELGNYTDRCNRTGATMILPKDRDPLWWLPASSVAVFPWFGLA